MVLRNQVHDHNPGTNPAWREFAAVQMLSEGEVSGDARAVARMNGCTRQVEVLATPVVEWA